MTAKISIRKMGTRLGQPHYGAECVTCGTVLVVAHVGREYAQELGKQHREQGCVGWGSRAHLTEF